MKIASHISFLFLFLSNGASAQQTYFQQRASAQQTYFQQREGLLNENKEDRVANIGIFKIDAFVGCIDYKMAYTSLPTEDQELKEKAELVIETRTESSGVRKTRCYNDHGDWVSIYPEGKRLDRVWYFADSNEEYTLFTNGVMKFMVNDKAEPEGFDGLAITKLKQTNNRKKILNYETHQIILETESEINTEYWVSHKLLRKPVSYENYKLAYTNEIMKVVQGVPLYKKTTINHFFITIEEAVDIQFRRPDADVFVLPQVDLYHW